MHLSMDYLWDDGWSVLLFNLRAYPGNPMRFCGTVLLAAMLLAQPAWANKVSGPLAPGKAAGVAAAQIDSRVDKLAVAGAAGLAVVAIYLIVGTHYHNPGNGNGNQSASSTH